MLKRYRHFEGETTSFTRGNSVSRVKFAGIRETDEGERAELVIDGRTELAAPKQSFNVDQGFSFRVVNMSYNEYRRANQVRIIYSISGSCEIDFENSQRI